MIIKTFRAETSSAALKRVREEMGGDAIVLKTTQETGALGRIIYEVTACLENPTVGQSSKIFADENVVEPKIEETTLDLQTEKVSENLLTPLPKTETASDDVWQKRYEKLELKINTFLEHDFTKSQATPNRFEGIIEQLHEHDFCQSFIDEFVTELEESYDESENVLEFAKNVLTKKVEQYVTDEFSLQEGDTLAVVGPAGSGKSSVMGKLATSLVLKDKKKVMLLTLDDVKMGAFDETAAYAEILGAEYADTRTADASSIKPDTITLIDTVAISKVTENNAPVNEKLDMLGTTYRVAVYSAIMRSKDVALMSEQMKAIHPTHLVITKTDLSDCLGTFITAAHTFGLKIIYTTDSHGGIGSLHTPHANELVNLILQEEVLSE